METKSLIRGDSTARSPPIYREYPKRWGMLAIYCLVLATSAGGLGPLGISVDSSQAYYDLSNLTFNTVFLASYGQFAISMQLWSYIVDVKTLRLAMICGTLTMTAGFVIQLFYKPYFWLALVGGTLADTARSLIWSTSTTFLARWFSSRSKAQAYGIIFAAAATVSVGLLAVTRFVITTPQEFEDRYLYIVSSMLLMSATATTLVIFLFEEKPPTAPGPQTDTKSTIGSDRRERACSWMCSPCRSNNTNQTKLYSAAYLMTVMGTWSSASVLLQVMKDHDYTNSAITNVGIIYALCSLPTPILTGYLMDLTKDYRSVVIGIVGAASLSFGMFLFTIDQGRIFYLAIATMSFATGSFSISFCECVTELAFPMREKNISMFLFFWAQFGGAVGTLLASFPDVVWTALMVFEALYIVVFVALVVDRAQVNVDYQRIVLKSSEARTVRVEDRVVISEIEI